MLVATLGESYDTLPGERVVRADEGTIREGQEF